MSTATQPIAAQAPPQEQEWNPVQELRKRYPGVANEPDQKIIQHLSNPENFRSAFPEYGHLDDTTIARNMSRYAQPAQPAQPKGLWDRIKEANKPAGENGDASWWQKLAPAIAMVGQTAGAVGDWAKQKAGELQTRDLTEAAQGKSPRSGWNALRLHPEDLETAGTAARMVGGLAQPKSAALLVAGKVAPELAGGYMAVEGLSGASENRQAIKDLVTTGQADPDALERFFTSGAEAAGGAAGVGEGMKGGVANSATGKVVSAANRTVLKPAAEGFTIGMPGEAMVKKGLAPYAKQTGYDAAMKQATDEILNYHKDSPIKTVRDLHEALPEIQERVAKERMNPVAQRHADELLPQERLDRAREAVEKSAGPFVEEFEPQQAQEVKALAEKIGRARTIGELMGKEASDRGGLMGYINGKLDSYFAKYPTARNADLMKNPDTAAWATARKAIRDEVLDHLEGQGETDIRDARKTWGALEELQKTTERRVNVNDRSKPMPLGRILGLVGAPLTAGASIVAGEIATHLNKPDVLVSRGLNRMLQERNGDVKALTPPTNSSVSMPPARALSEAPKSPSAVKLSTDSMGIRWAESPQGYRVSIPKGVPEGDIENYATGKLSEQARIHGQIQERSQAAPRFTKKEEAPAGERTQEETNAIRAELSEMKSKSRKMSDKFARARDWRAGNQYRESMEAADRRAAELQDALDTGKRIKLGLRGATRDELTETYRSLSPELKSRVGELLQEYQMTTGLARERFIAEHGLQPGAWRGLPIQEKLARHVLAKSKTREPGEDEEEGATHGGGPSPF